MVRGALCPCDREHSSLGVDSAGPNEWNGMNGHECCLIAYLSHAN